MKDSMIVKEVVLLVGFVFQCKNTLQLIQVLVGVIELLAKKYDGTKSLLVLTEKNLEKE
ncbi:hypothetical protein X801_06442, partial [Opisthorchis viverrini]